MKQHRIFATIILMMISTLLAGFALGQTINIPPNPNIDVGTILDLDTTYNIFPGGRIRVNCTGGDGVVVNVEGGELESGFRANDGCIVNISSGEVGDSLSANAGCVVNIFDGDLGMEFPKKS